MFHRYGLIVGLGVVAVWAVAERLEPKAGKALPWILFGALVGARAYHVIDQWGYYSTHLANIFYLWNGGLAIWGGVAGGVGALFIYYYTVKTLNYFWGTLGAICTALPLGQAVGRWGNAVNGEFTNPVLGVVPWWLAESTLDLLLFIELIGLIGPMRRIGEQGRRQVGLYLVGYGLIRGMLDWARVAPWTISEVPVAVWISVVTMLAGTVLLLYKKYPHGV